MVQYAGPASSEPYKAALIAAAQKALAGIDEKAIGAHFKFLLSPTEAFVQRFETMVDEIARGELFADPARPKVTELVARINVHKASFLGDTGYFASASANTRSEINKAFSTFASEATLAYDKHRPQPASRTHAPQSS